MRKMTSLEAQNHFDEMLDASQRDLVLITRHSRPVSFVFSPHADIADMRAILFQFIKMVSMLTSLRGKQASKELSRVLSKLGKKAQVEQLTKADIARMIKESA